MHVFVFVYGLIKLVIVSFFQNQIKEHAHPGSKDEEGRERRHTGGAAGATGPSGAAASAGPTGAASAAVSPNPKANGGGEAKPKLGRQGTNVIKLF